MRLIQLVDFVADFTGKPTYPLEFPYNTKIEDVLVVDIINGAMAGSVIDMNIQIMARSAHPSIAEERCNVLLESLHNQTNLMWDGLQIILIQAKNPNPFYNGQDSNNNYIYTTDFRLLVTN